jgi:hypothetical protein
VALVYNDATLHPTKHELLTSWVEAQPWAVGGDAAELERVGAFRFDDPAGEVGIETHLLRGVDGRLLQVPLTYRAVPLAGADAALLGTMEHSVLGARWVYDGCADPVYAAALATTILTGGREAEIEFADGQRHRGPTQVHGSGSAPAIGPVDAVISTTHGAATRIAAGEIELLVWRVVPDSSTGVDAEILTGTWPGQDDPVVLAAGQRGSGTHLSTDATSPFA